MSFLKISHSSNSSIFISMLFSFVVGINIVPLDTKISKKLWCSSITLVNMLDLFLPS